MAHTADVIIIGGGVQGAALAFHLAQRGVKATVLEKQHVAAGATGRSSGLVRMHYDTEVDSRLAWESFQYFRDWKERVGGECGFTRTGFIQIVSQGQEAALQANVRMQQAIGIAALVVTAEDVKRLAPGFIVQDFNVAAYEPESGYAMPSDSANALMDAARRKGALLVQDCAVIGILESGGKVTGVQTSRGQYSAPLVVNAAGAWAGFVNRMARLDLPLTTWRHETMYVRRPREERLPHPTVIDFSLEMYFRPEGGLTLVGLEDGNPLGESPDSDVEHAREGFVARAVERLCKRMPRLEKGSLHSAHGGYDGITPDQHPLLGAAGPDGFYLDCGHSGTGFKTAPAVGKCIAELILDGKAQTVDIHPLETRAFRRGAGSARELPEYLEVGKRLS